MYEPLFASVLATLAVSLSSAGFSFARHDTSLILILSSQERPVPTEVIVKLTPAATALGAEARRSLDQCVRDFGISITPLHPGTFDPDLATYFVATVAMDSLDDVLERLRRCPGVEGAYAKPAGEPPERR